MTGRTILIIDDDRELAEGIRAALERAGHRVAWCRNGVEGKEAIYREKPDLVLIDMMMQRMGGYPVLEHFRDKTDAPPFIMMTANEGSRHKAYAEYLGVKDYVRKPFAMDRMLDAVNQVFTAVPSPEAVSETEIPIAPVD
jgi:DNA-binding response OmpR family regulator